MSDDNTPHMMKMQQLRGSQKDSDERLDFSTAGTSPIKEARAAIERYHSGLSDEDWRKLPMTIRSRWWKETNYGRIQPSADLLVAVFDAAKKLYGLDGRDNTKII